MMKKILLALAILTATAITLSPVLLLQTKKVELPSAVQIETAYALGSGVRIDKNTILTAQHVVGHETAVAVVDAEGARVKATVVFTDYTNDIALLYANPSERVRVAPLLCVRPKTGEAIEHFGFPLGQRLSYFQGRVVNENAEMGEWPVWSDSQVVNLGTGPGSSGGPIYQNRSVVGIVVGMFSRQPTMMIAIPGETVCKSIGWSN